MNKNKTKQKLNVKPSEKNLFFRRMFFSTLIFFFI